MSVRQEKREKKGRWGERRVRKSEGKKREKRVSREWWWRERESVESKQECEEKQREIKREKGCGKGQTEWER